VSNEVRIVVTGSDRSKGMFGGVDQGIRKVDQSATTLADRGFSRAESAGKSFKETLKNGAGAVGGLTGAMVAADMVLDKGITVSLTKANAQVALGEQGFATLSAAAEKNANVMGFTESEFLATAGSAGSLAKNLGFSEVAAAKLGAAFPDLSDKLAVLSNGKVSAAEAADQLRSAMAGEFDPLQAMGIAINAASVETKALALQQASATEITKEQATAMAVLAIVQEQTADASKVMATEAGRSAAEAQAAQAELRQAYEELSAAAVPVLKELTQATAGYAESWKTLFDSSTPFVDRAQDLVNVLAPLTNVVDAVMEKTVGQGDASQQAALDVAELSEGATGAAKSEEELAKATKEATSAIQDQIGVVLGARDAARKYQESLDTATESLRENGKTLDITTEQGRANSKALDDIATAALGQAEAVREAGGSEADYRGQLERSRADLIRTAERFGMSRTAARNYANAILGIPKKYDTRVKLDAQGALQKAREVRIAIRNIQGKTVFVNIRETTFRSAVDIAHDRGEKRTGGVWGGAAGGGARSGMVLVGEEGPELVQLGAGAMVHTAGATRRMLGGGGAGGGSGPAVLELRSSGSDVDELLLRVLRRAIRQRGGNAQTVLGTGRGRTTA
jgi:hypothetical protein